VQRAIAGSVPGPSVSADAHRLTPVLGLDVVGERQRVTRRPACHLADALQRLAERHAIGGGDARLFAREQRHLADVVDCADVGGPQPALVEGATIVGGVLVGVLDELAELRDLERMELVQRGPLGPLEPVQMRQRRATAQRALPTGVGTF